MDSTDAWHYALTLFLVLTGLSLSYVFLRMSGTFERINLLLDGLVQEVVPLLSKVSTSVDHVNDELEKVGQITDSAVDATESVDHTVRAITEIISKPVKAASGVSAGIKHGFESFKAKRDQRGGVV
ncbi:MAG: DUF948 domain-containing protein [Gaiellales bacterium]